MKSKFVRVTAALALLISGAVAGSVASADSNITTASTGRVHLVRRSGNDDVSFLTWGDVPNATASVVVSSGQSATLVMRFSADSACGGSFGDPSGKCLLRFLVNGQEAYPNGGVTFDSNHHGYGVIDDYTSHEFEASTGTLSAGKYVVTLQAQVVGSVAGGTNYEPRFGVGYWQMTVERF